MFVFGCGGISRKPDFGALADGLTTTQRPAGQIKIGKRRWPSQTTKRRGGGWAKQRVRKGGISIRRPGSHYDLESDRC
jgi:hypothetical protein